MKTFLHVGCGRNRKDQAGPGFRNPSWQEIRFDINPDVQPDIIGTMTDMKAVDSESVDAVFSSHNIEHLYAHEVVSALSEFKRVLKADGFVVISCPDLQSIAELIANDKLTETAYQSPAGPIAPIDMVYGLRAAIAQGNHFMAHRCGFTQKVLAELLSQSGFARAIVRQRPAVYDLWALAIKSELSDEKLKALARQHFPQLP